MLLLDVKNIFVHFDGSVALKGVSMKVREGEIVTLIGANGAGKTTMLNTISALKRADEGEIWFDGKRIDTMSPQHIVKIGVGHVPQGRALFPNMSVLDHLKIGAFSRNDDSEFRADLRKIYRYFPILQKRTKQLANTLSGGEQQMLAIARALMGRTRLLMLDEPSLALSPILVKEIGKVLEELNRDGVSILLVEQNAKLAFRLAHRGYVLQTGSIVQEGSTKELSEGDLVAKAYLGK